MLIGSAVSGAALYAMLGCELGQADTVEMENTLCGEYTVWRIYSVENTLCGEYTVWRIHCVENIQCDTPAKFCFPAPLRRAY